MIARPHTGKLLKYYSVLMMCSALSACVSSSQFVPSGQVETVLACEKIDFQTLKLNGPTNQTMLDCVGQNITDDTKHIIITSFGGSPEKGMDIAEIIAPHKANITVLTSCESSCANYILPVAAQVSVAADSYIMLHGSIDPGFLLGVDTSLEADDLAYLEGLAAKQRKFADRYSIPPAWLLWREKYTNDIGSIAGLIGTFEDFDPSATKRSKMIVGQDFMQSCFPSIPIDYESGHLIERADDDPERAGALAQEGYYKTGPARCAQIEQKPAPEDALLEPEDALLIVAK